MGRASTSSQDDCKQLCDVTPNCNATNWMENVPSKIRCVLMQCPEGQNPAITRREYHGSRMNYIAGFNVHFSTQFILSTDCKGVNGLASSGYDLNTPTAVQSVYSYAPQHSFYSNALGSSVTGKYSVAANTCE